MKKILFLLGLALGFQASAQSVFDVGVPFAKYKVQTDECSSFRYRTGSEITIPEDAFENSCADNVVIRYRELHDPVDILLAKMPMNLEGGRMLETGGMFEIYAECQGQPVRLKPGKKIEVKMAALKEVEDLETFYFDQPKNAWVPINKPVTTVPVSAGFDDSELWGGSFPSPLNFTLEEDDFSSWCCDENEWESDPASQLKFEVFRAMEIDQFGMFNYDRLLKEDDAIPIVASFELAAKPGEDLQFPIHVAYEGINSLITFWPSDFATNFRLLPRGGMKIFLVLEDGSIARFPQEELEKLDLMSLKNESYKFTLTRELILPKDRDDLAKLIAKN